jgi:hypothetical protein
MNRAVPLVAATVLVCGVQAPASVADTPKFPDLSDYTPVNAQDYAIAFDNPGRQPTMTDYFLTPNGIVCVIDDGGAACFGNNLPSIPALEDPDSRVTYIDTQKGLYQSLNTGYVDGATIHGQQIHTLPAAHSITVAGTVCGVSNSGTTACKDSQGRGFILSPAWSGWLPKV